MSLKRKTARAATRPGRLGGGRIKQILSTESQFAESCLELSGDAFVSIDASGRIENATSSVASLFGLSPAALQHQEIYQYFVEEDAALLRARIETPADRKRRSPFKARTRSVAQAVTTVQVRLLQQEPADGKASAGGSTLCLMPAELPIGRERTDNKFKELFDDAPVMYVMARLVEGEPLIEDCNTMYCKTLGYDRKEVLGRNLRDFFTTDSVQKCRSSEEAGPGLICEQRELVTRDGSVIKTLLRASPWFDQEQGFVGMRSMFVDITRRVYAEEALQRSERAFSGFIEVVPEIVFTFAGTEGILTSLNAHFEQLTGWSRDTWIGQPLAALVHPDDLEAANECLSTAVDGEKEALAELRLRRKSGGYCVVEIITAPVSINGKRDERTAFARDVTERHTAQEAMRLSEERYRALYDDNPSMYFSVDASGVIVSVNEFGADQLGFEVDELLGTPVVDLFYGEDREAVLEKFHTCVRSPRQFFQWEFRKVHKNGDIIWVKESSRAVYDAAGDIVVLIVCEDITEWKEATRALEHSEERFRDLFENAPDTYIILNASGRIVRFNQRGLSKLGYALSEVIDQPVLKYIHQSEQLRASSLIESFRNSSQQNANMQVRFRCSDGRFVCMSIEFSRVQNASNQLEAIRATCRDITEKARLEEELARAQRLETAGRLAGQIAHDFNNLLAPLAGYPELIREELPAGSASQGLLSEIEQAGQTIGELNQQLLALGRRGHFKFEAVDLNELVTNTLNACKIPGRIETCLELDDDLLLLAGGPAQIGRAISNLCTNAIESMPDIGALKISTGNIYLDEPVRGYQTVARGEYVKFEIADSGSGIPQDILDNVFDPFFTTKKMDARRGSGLGLSVVHGVLNDHKGYVTVESLEGIGTTFALYFPVARDVELARPTAKSIERGNFEKVMVVDDDPYQRKVIGRLLRHLQYDVSLASSGEEAVRALKRHPQDLLLLDMAMDGMDGADTYREIIRFRPEQRAIILSGYAMSDQVKKALALGVGEFMSKPVTLYKLSAAVRQELAGDAVA